MLVEELFDLLGARERLSSDNGGFLELGVFAKDGIDELENGFVKQLKAEGRKAQTVDFPDPVSPMILKRVQ